MADTALQVVVSPFLEVVLDNLSSLIGKKFGLIWGLPKEMKKLQSTLSTIQNVIQDAEDKQLTNKPIVNWLRKLKDATYDADDVLDECAYEGLQLAYDMANTSCTKLVTDSLSSCLNLKQVSLRCKIAKKIKRLNERFDNIAEERSKFHLSEGIAERKVEFSRDRETSSMLAEREYYGRAEDKEKLVNLLLNDVSNQEDISVCPIFGIGGLGKTALAQMIYNGERIKNHFEAKAWVCVSDDFDVKRIIKSIIVSLSGGACDLEELDHLQRHLQEKLSGKIFLLVLDDVWNDDLEEWNKLKYSLRGGAKGSWVIVTTRIESVASITGTVDAHRLEVLSEDDCWSLFKQGAFVSENEERPDLVEIGKQILKKCGGVPLAAKALGGLMRFKSEQRQWLLVRDSEIWELNKENKILPALRLSYNHLPSHLRQCFAFCSIYPKDHEILKEDLLQLWIASGLVQAKGRMELEDVANDIFHDLLWRSLFQEAKKDEDGNIFVCKMHDLVHDLACSITNECSLLKDDQTERVDESIRHLSLNLQSCPKTLPKLPPVLRTFLLMNGSYSDKVPQLDFSNLEYLRVLDLTYSKIKTFPILTSNLKHLRYLDLSRTPISSLPESICSLKILLVLKLVDCRYLKMLPTHMSKMSSLTHLYISGCKQLTYMPLGMGQLVQLQTLSIYIVGRETGRHIKELKQLDLRGELCIKGLELVRNSMDAREAKLIEKENLRSLGLTWSQEHAAEVIEGFHPHQNLKRLSIEGYGGVNFPSWLGVSSLPKLGQVVLKDCKRIESLPSFGELRFLEVLQVANMPELKEWNSLAENGREMPMLPALKWLTIENCPKLTKVPVLLSIEYLTLYNCNEMVLRLLHNLPRLSSLRIFYFNELTSFPEGVVGNHTALFYLTIEGCNKLCSLPMEMKNLTSLTFLTISICKELSCFPEELQNLTYLRLTNCNGVRSLPFLRSCHSLRTMSIQNCGNLISLSEGLQHLTTLEDLSISGCGKLEFSPEDFQQLISLRRLDLSSLPQLTSLPRGLQQVSTLESLMIFSCSGLKLLPQWLGGLTSLQVLKIQFCENLERLPEEMQHLITLRTLEIRLCSDQLRRRYEKDKGEDWHKISHIRKVIIE